MKKLFVLILAVSLLFVTGCNPDVTTIEYDSDSKGSAVTPVPPALVSISLNTSIAETLFFEGDAFSYDGLVVTAHYDDETSAVVEDFTVNPGTAMNSLGVGKAISVSYKEFTETYNIDVAARFHETVQKVGTKTFKGTDSVNKELDVVTFGDWPRTVMPESFTATERTYVMGGNTYNLGSDGNWYLKQKENGYDIDAVIAAEGSLAINSTDVKPRGQSGENINYYSDGTVVKNSTSNSYRWYKVEPIQWVVIGNNDSGNAILFADEQVMAGIKYFESKSERTINGKTIKANDYKYSSVRAYLNGCYEELDTQEKLYANKGFLQSAFTSAASNLIEVTTVKNGVDDCTPAVESIGAVTVAEDCNDKIFLLSTKEITNSEYGFQKSTSGSGKDTLRYKMFTDYALANHALNSAKWSDKGSYYWLRSAINDGAGVRRITISGYAMETSSVATLAYGGGIVPTLCVSPDSISE